MTKDLGKINYIQDTINEIQDEIAALNKMVIIAKEYLQLLKKQ